MLHQRSEALFKLHHVQNVDIGVLQRHHQVGMTSDHLQSLEGANNTHLGGVFVVLTMTPIDFLVSNVKRYHFHVFHSVPEESKNWGVAP